MKPLKESWLSKTMLFAAAIVGLLGLSQAALLTPGPVHQDQGPLMQATRSPQRGIQDIITPELREQIRKVAAHADELSQ